MIQQNTFWAVAMAITLAAPALALNQDDEDGLKDTKALLQNQQRLDSFGKDNPDAKKALGDMNALTGGDPAKMAEVNAISAAVFEEMVRKDGGDSADIMKKLQDGMKDPAGFMKGLSPEQQARIHKLGAEIDQQNAKIDGQQGGRVPASVKQ